MARKTRSPRVSEKLVRDRIPELAKAGKWKDSYFRVAEGKEYQDFLCAKLLEEAKEVIQAKTLFEKVGELVDLQTIIGALLESFKVDDYDFGIEVDNKYVARGGFEKGYIFTTKERAEKIKL